VDLDREATPAHRRRGQELEDALLDAAWDELSEHGYGALTFEAVAERAGTSRPVINRRWKTREELVVAAVRHNSEVNRLPLPDTGTLRGDVIALLEQVNGSRLQAAVVFAIQLGTYFQETGTAPADLRLEMLGSRTDTSQLLVRRAMERGEIPTRDLPARVTSLPFDLSRHEFIMTLKPLSREVILEIVDGIFLPLVSG
jgi:AcrR family transcriptional regulator